MTIKQFIGIKFLLLLAFISITSPSFAQNIPEHARAQIGFGSTISDTEIVGILQKHKVSPKAGFMWMSGLTGSHRMYEEISAEKFLEDARANSIEYLTSALEGHRIFIQNFIDNNTEEDINEDEKLQIEARSLLNLVKQHENGLVSLRSHKPIIFAIEIEGKDSELEEIINEPIVKTSAHLESSKTSNMAGGNSIKPQAYKAEFKDPDVLTASPKALYRLLLQASKK